MHSSYRDLLDHAFEDLPVNDVLAAPPAALQGVGPQGSAHFVALGARTLRELGEHRAFHAARALLAASGQPAFDPGPPDAWATLFAAAPLPAYLANPAQFRTRFGPVFYRGRLDGTARVLVVGQDPSTDEVLAQRTFVGQSGQRVQGLLRKLGLTRSYVMVNTFLFGIQGQFGPAFEALSLSAPIRAHREAILSRIASQNPLEAIVSFGNGAKHALASWSQRPAQVPWVQLAHPAADSSFTLTDWNRDLPALLAAVSPDAGQVSNPSPYGSNFGAADVADVPRHDLPFGIPSWHGTGGGTRSQRDGDAAIRWTAP